MYSLSGYGSMIADRVRLDAYAEAMRRSIRPGATVLEIGTGPGIFAVLACQLGAARVYAIEPAEVVQVAREVAAANGCADKMEFIENLSTKIELSVRADVIVSDLRGVLPLFQQHIPSIADARKRLLAPNGILIPCRDRIWAAIVEAPETYGSIVDPWENNALKLDLARARDIAVNSHIKARAKPEQLLAAPQPWAELDYCAIEDPNHRAALTWSVARPGTGHGLLAWFETELIEGVGFSNAPSQPEAIYGSLFFPWTQPVALVPGQRVCVDLAARLVSDDYVWRWSTRICSPDDSAQIVARFDQSDLAGAVLSAEKLRRQASDFVPHLSDEGRLRLRSMELIDGKRSLEEIARCLAAEFPARFERWQQALSYAASISAEFTR